MYLNAYHWAQNQKNGEMSQIGDKRYSGQIGRRREGQEGGGMKGEGGGMERIVGSGTKRQINKNRVSTTQTTATFLYQEHTPAWLTPQVTFLKDKKKNKPLTTCDFAEINSKPSNFFRQLPPHNNITTTNGQLLNYNAHSKSPQTTHSLTQVPQQFCDLRGGERRLLLCCLIHRVQSTHFSGSSTKQLQTQLTTSSFQRWQLDIQKNPTLVSQWPSSSSLSSSSSE